jgi:hypothetical protein
MKPIITENKMVSNINVSILSNTESAVLTDSQKENSQTSRSISIYNTGLQRFQQQQPKVDDETSLMDSYQKWNTSKPPPTSLQMLQDSTNRSNALNANVGIMNDGDNTTTTPSDSSCIQKASYNHMSMINPLRPEMLKMDLSSRTRFSLPSSSTNNMNRNINLPESENSFKKRVIVHQDQSDPNSSGPSKKQNPYQNGRGTVDVPII